MANKLRNAVVPPVGACRPDEPIASDVPAENAINQHPPVTYHHARASVTVLIIMMIIFVPKPREFFFGGGQRSEGFVFANSRRRYHRFTLYQSNHNLRRIPSFSSHLHRLTSTGDYYKSYLTACRLHARRSRSSKPHTFVVRDTLC